MNLANKIAICNAAINTSSKTYCSYYVVDGPLDIIMGCCAIFIMIGLSIIILLTIIYMIKEMFL